ncbi:MAG TPA: type II secretion system protein GspF [Gammaproteobacteria bacterium]|nr:type II secretion system protein GspF [Gammaproteobacteria bacterium]
MPAYEYRALNPKGREEKGVLEGDTAKQIRQQLREKSLVPLDVSEIKDRSEQKNGAPASRSSLKTADLALITRQIATLLEAGTPLDETLGAVANQSNKAAVERIILAVRGKVVEGHTFADSLRQFPGAFPDLYRSTVAAGENSGHLDKVLDRLADYTENYQAMQQKISTALIYPVLLTVIAIVVVSGLLGYVVPQVVGVFINLGQELPGLTQGLIAVSDVVKAYGLYVTVFVILAVIIFFRLYKRPGFQRRVDRNLLRVPIIGNLVRGKNTAAFTRTLSILTASGVPIIDALKNASETIGNMPMREAVQDTVERVREGAGISSSLQKTGLFPPMTMHLMQSGEASGRLEKMLERAADQQERETTSMITAAISLFEPTLIVVMGIVVLIIVLAILLPIFELNQLVG